jgi:hypothetical protein
MFSPTRVPVPPASTTATLRMVATAYPGVSVWLEVGALHNGPMPGADDLAGGPRRCPEPAVAASAVAVAVGRDPVVVVLAASAHHAARRFGPRFDDAVFTTASGVDAEIVGRRVNVVAVVADEAALASLRWALKRRLWMPHTTLIVEEPVDGKLRRSVRTLLEQAAEAPVDAGSDGCVVLGPDDSLPPAFDPVAQTRAAEAWRPAPSPKGKPATRRPPTSSLPPHVRGSRRVLSRARPLADLLGARNRPWALAALGAAALLSLGGLIALGLTLGVGGVLLGVLVCLILVLVLGLAAVVRIQRRQLRRLRHDLDRTNTRLSTELSALADDVEKQRKAIGQTATRGAVTTRRVADVAADLEERIQITGTLFTLVGPQLPLPPAAQSDAAPEVLVELLVKYLERRPRVLLACGSGTSTLVLALAVRKYEVPSRVVCIDHDAERLRTTGRLLTRHGVGDVVELRHAPLRRIIRGPDLGASWYDASALGDLEDLGLVFVDGPPASAGPRSRHALSGELRGRLAADCVIVVNDAGRVDEQAPGGTWADVLPGFERQLLSVGEADVVVLRSAPRS